MVGFDPTKIGAEFRYNDASFNIPLGTPVQFLPANPYRVALFMSTSTASVFVRPNNPPSGTLGFVVPNGQAPLQIKLNEVGPLVQQQWNVFCSGGGLMYYLEVIWQPP